MRPLLLDEGLPRAIAAALATLGLEAHAVGDPGAPPKQSSDEVNCQWCRGQSAVLVTNDRGRKDRTILDLLARMEVDAIFVHNDLRSAATHTLAKAILNSEGKIDQLSSSRTRIRHRLRPGGGLDKR